MKTWSLSLLIALGCAHAPSREKSEREEIQVAAIRRLTGTEAYASENAAVVCLGECDGTAPGERCRPVSMAFLRRFAEDKARYARSSDCDLVGGAQLVLKESVSRPGKTLRAVWTLFDPVVFESARTATVKVFSSSGPCCCSQRIVRLEQQAGAWVAVSDEDTGLQC